jgi:hypothetical protein
MLDGYCRQNESIIGFLTIKKQFIAEEINRVLQQLQSHLFYGIPRFITQFESLLIDTELTQTKMVVLNTELRIVALIRLGSKDSAKIYHFFKIFRFYNLQFIALY